MQHSIIHQKTCKVIDEQTLWGKTLCRVWFPDTNTIETVPKESLRSIDADECASTPEVSQSTLELCTIAAAARVADALATYSAPGNDGVLLAPLESAVTPLPHQISALKRAVQANPSRFLLADEVGLGKTIEAGLIIKELRLRGLVKRVLVVAPTGLVRQWVSEMATHFGETFHLFLPREMEALSSVLQAARHRLQVDDLDDEDFNPWTISDNVICPMDAIKPLTRRKGWTEEQVDEYNTERYLRVINAGWDLVVIDEAHRVAGSDPSVARFKLGRGLGRATPHLLLLSATPHQGKSDAFFRLMNILDDAAFPGEDSVNRSGVEPLLIRHEKRSVVDHNDDLLFRPRTTRLMTVSWDERHSCQQQLYQEVTAYVREGYKHLERVVLRKRKAVGFLLVLMQRLVTSSTRAVRQTLERRLNALQNPDVSDLEDMGIAEDEWEELDGDAQIELLLEQHVGLTAAEQEQVKGLLDLARQAEAQSPDVKAEKLLETIYDLQAKENDPNLKLLIFTEFTATQDMLVEHLEARGISTTVINGKLDMDERQRNQKRFAEDIQVLVSTEAGGEGLNLQFCHVVLNYDMPWNPMRIEQRIGRVDRIGQKREVIALNLMIEDTVEARVRQVIERKLDVIFQEMGIDKIGDVLDSGDVGRVFDDVYVKAIQNPDAYDSSVDRATDELRRVMSEVREYEELYLPSSEADSSSAADYIHHPFPFWVEKMVTGHLQLNGGAAKKTLMGWKLRWPDGKEEQNVVFSTEDMEKWAEASFLSVANPNVAKIPNALLRTQRSNSVPSVVLPTLPDTVEGTWALWRLTATSTNWQKHRLLPLFVHANGKVYPTTAKAVWDAMLTDDVRTDSTSAEPVTEEDLRNHAEQTFESTYQGLLAEFEREQEIQRTRQDKLFWHRMRAISKVAIDNIRESKKQKLQTEYDTWKQEWDSAFAPLPELELILSAHVKGGQA